MGQQQPASSLPSGRLLSNAYQSVILFNCDRLRSAKTGRSISQHSEFLLNYEWPLRCRRITIALMVNIEAPMTTPPWPMERARKTYAVGRMLADRRSGTAKGRRAAAEIKEIAPRHDINMAGRNANVAHSRDSSFMKLYTHSHGRQTLRMNVTKMRSHTAVVYGRRFCSESCILPRRF